MTYTEQLCVLLDEENEALRELNELDERIEKLECELRKARLRRAHLDKRVHEINDERHKLMRLKRIF
jgi:chromosome segregation ATPase